MSVCLSVRAVLALLAEEPPPPPPPPLGGGGGSEWKLQPRHRVRTGDFGAQLVNGSV